MEHKVPPCKLTAIKLRKTRRSGRDCRNQSAGSGLASPEGCRAGQPGMSPEAKDGEGLSHPCELDTGNPCRHDGAEKGL